ncbi:hypothetical protein Rsub_02678 [Raphidocelis subcapitata]|uniref:Uncharacterized protein n=1 Tax=Raphidocelis subcapitata TaxID=307507 RepID=A0A2V0NTH6_9CHLO|nr:hypothetical protein Rsub_02678 [Raphidocelis subcapitata]|eukprot:GBF89972.1 hypothetical protein Rsub_02678 [Raphidocelis subcapitata]
MQLSLYDGERLRAQQRADDVGDGAATLGELLARLDPSGAAAAGSGADCEVSVLEKSGLWRTLGGASLQQTLSAAGAAPGAADALRFRLRPPQRRGQAGGAAARRRRAARTAARWVVAAVKAVLVLEAVGWGMQLLGGRRGGARRRRREGDDDSGTDPADLLMSYLSGAAGEEALARLGTEAMADAVDALGTSDYEELGVEDGGVELRGAVEDLIAERRARKEGGAAPGGPGGGSGAAGAPPRRGAAPLGESGRPVIRRAAWKRPAEPEGGAGADGAGDGK